MTSEIPHALALRPRASSNSGERLPRGATLFVAAGEPDVDLASGEDGLELLTLQFRLEAAIDDAG